MRAKLCVAAVGLLLCAGAVTAEAQVRFAPQASFGSETDFGIGARAKLELANMIKSPGFFGIGEFNYFFPSGPLNYWEINANLGYIIPGAQRTAHPYVGAGLNIGHASVNCGTDTGSGISYGGCSSTDVGFNFLGGLNFHTRTKLTPYIEARAQLGHGNQFVATGGVYF
ncbi:MAG: hypothetical protein ABI613_06290 [Gemmatimonadota bacterium]